ncbi:serine hydrolase-like protein isoform X2 [Eurytemora carolleeae]|uniref:serine hydrolase-like protein isoform X1 n=1 Tax=Eurytemora carolleeae TaxID=1294199 RepID=UPI000C771CD2|nr:serine hydrolase-like protein isoform X1 [Eurytemora carolleeae]XP_023343646.1 serine hydrolase-like protein isoform X2 [Eurytemora carolleeae]|eukprot:XP_023343645.1 serine hydrolase-like protein isoform X1 [Eurytemora affinis]
MSRERVFPVPWGKIAAQEWGNNQANQHWLLVHGWLDNSNSWIHLAPLLADRGDHVIAIDLPGCGMSSWLPKGMMYHDLEILGAIHRVVLQLNWKRFGLIGHSLGGGLVLTYAATFPESVSHLVMLDITFVPIRPLTPYSFQPRVRKSIESFLFIENKLESGYDKVFKSKEEARDRLMKPPVYLKEHGVTETYTVESADILLERGLEKVDVGYRLRRDIRWVVPSLYFLDFNDQREQGKNIRCPHLIIEASKGPKSEFAHSMYPIFRTNPEFVSHHLEGLHHIHMNQHNKVNEIILEFLNSAHQQRKAKM